MTEINLVYITVPSHAEALRIGNQLVEECLVACANIIDGMTSIYRWQGKLVQDKETLLFLKTESSRVEEVIARVKDLHPYECPAIIALPILQGFDPFVQWVKESTSKQS